MGYYARRADHADLFRRVRLLAGDLFDAVADRAQARSEPPYCASRVGSPARYESKALCDATSLHAAAPRARRRESAADARPHAHACSARPRSLRTLLSLVGRA